MVINRNFSFVRGSAGAEGRRIADELVEEARSQVAGGFGVPHEIGQVMTFAEPVKALFSAHDSMPAVDQRLQGGWVQVGTSELGVPSLHIHFN